MLIFITGVGCVGKSTVGEKLAVLLNVSFFDLDKEIEKYFRISLERMQNNFLTVYSFRKEASKALKSIIANNEGRDCVIALPPSGLMEGYWREVKKAKGVTLALTDDPENILKRIVFYDIESRPIQRTLTDKEKRYYLGEIKKDITYFGKSYKRAAITVDIKGCNPDEAAHKVKSALESALQKVGVTNTAAAGDLI